MDCSKKYRNTIEFEVYGDSALFTDPATKISGEKMTLPVPTYEALKGIVKNIYWKPTIIWYVDEVRIMNPIQTFSEGNLTLNYFDSGKRMHVYTYLAKCRYQVRAHFEWNMNREDMANDRNENKHFEIAKRSLENGGRRIIYLGVSECPAYVKPCVFGEGDGFYDSIKCWNLGMMYHGINYPDEGLTDKDRKYISKRFDNYILENGIIHFRRPEQCKNVQYLGEAEIKNFKNHQKEEGD